MRSAQAIINALAYGMALGMIREFEYKKRYKFIIWLIYTLAFLFMLGLST